MPFPAINGVVTILISRSRRYMSANHRVLKFCRTIHLYLGVFTAPALLFFAITGGLQTFSFHETTRGSSYAPPAWLETVALLHKKQTTTAPPKRPRSTDIAATAMARVVATAPATTDPLNKDGSRRDGAADAAGRSAGDKLGSADHGGDKPKKSLLPMKLFFALVAVALALSTMTGIYMSYRYTRKPKLVSTILIAGILLPLALLLF